MTRLQEHLTFWPALVLVLYLGGYTLADVAEAFAEGAVLYFVIARFIGDLIIAVAG